MLLTRLNDKVKLTNVMMRKLDHTPFGHFRKFNRILVDTALLDDICGRWAEGNKFKFDREDGKVLEIMPEDVGLIFKMPYKGRPIEMEVGGNHTLFYEIHLEGRSLVRYNTSEIFSFFDSRI